MVQHCLDHHFTVLILHSPMEHKNEAFLRSYSLCLSKYSRVSLSSPHLHPPPLRFHMPWLSLALCSLPFSPFFSPASLSAFFQTSYVSYQLEQSLICLAYALPLGQRVPKDSTDFQSHIARVLAKLVCSICFPFFSDRNCWSYLLFVISSRDTRNKVMQPEGWSLPDNWKY